MQLRSIVLAQRPHEPADGDAEAPLVKTHETHNVGLGGASARSPLAAGRSTPAPPSRGSAATAGRLQTAPEPPRWRRISPTTMAPGHPTSLRVMGGCGNVSSGTFKVRSHSPSSSSFRSWLRAQDAGEAEKAKRDEGKWPGEPKTTPFSSFLFTATGGSAATARIYRIECGRFRCR